MDKQEEFTCCFQQQRMTTYITTLETERNSNCIAWIDKTNNWLGIKSDHRKTMATISLNITLQHYNTSVCLRGCFCLCLLSHHTVVWGILMFSVCLFFVRLRICQQRKKVGAWNSACMLAYYPDRSSPLLVNFGWRWVTVAVNAPCKPADALVCLSLFVCVTRKVTCELLDWARRNNQLDFGLIRLGCKSMFS